MGDIFLIILATILLLAGAIGTIAPIIPGLPLSWVSLLILKLLPSTKDDISWLVIVVLAVITTLITILDNILPVWGTKKMGGNKQVVWGATIGLLVGFFLGPWGILFGPFLGAFIGAVVTGNKFKLATKQASGAFGGYLVGLLLKLITVGFISFYFVRTLLI